MASADGQGVPFICLAEGPTAGALHYTGVGLHAAGRCDGWRGSSQGQRRFWGHLMLCMQGCTGMLGTRDPSPTEPERTLFLFRKGCSVDFG